MGKKKINIQSLLLLLFVLLTMHSYSQELFTKELKWEPCDSIKLPIFQNTSQIVEWGKSISPLASVQSEKFCIKNSDVFILKVDICSGIYCPSIYIFVVKNKFWQLVTSTSAKLQENIEIKVDNKQGKIIFMTDSYQIGELPFDKLNLSLDKTEQ
jgi:hypothetical protein